MNLSGRHRDKSKALKALKKSADPQFSDLDKPWGERKQSLAMQKNERYIRRGKSGTDATAEPASITTEQTQEISHGERRKALAAQNTSGTQTAKRVPERNKERRERRAAVKKRKRTAVDKIILVLAELLITIGLIGGMFVLWKFVIIDSITAGTQAAGANELIEDFSNSTDLGSLDYDKYDPPATTRVGDNESFAVLYIPRLDPNYKRVIEEGTNTRHVLNDKTTGIGHYSASEMPGELGNFALAGHRNTVFKNLKTVVPGDKLYVQTDQGYYTYEVQAENLIVKPSAIEVISAVPGDKTNAVEPEESWLTLTTCWPEWSNTERLIVHAKFLEWRPLAAGAPAEIAAAVNG